MKQKRKAKSLIPMHFNWNYGLLTNIILIIGGMLCFFALSLQTISVDALGTNGLYFSGYDDNTEVLYHMYYVDMDNQSEAGVIGEMYMNQTGSDSNFYIVPSRVLVQPNLEAGTHTLPNLVGYDNYVNILGGNDIKLYSDNMSVIAGEYNIAYEGNNNSVLLGGNGNTILTGNGSGLPVIVLGGVGNSVGKNQDGNIVIGGSDNEIDDGVSNSNIIGGEDNKVSGNGNIVGGTNVDVDDSISNIFVFSDSDGSFSPKSSNAFYLRTDNGVGLNEDPLVHDDWDNNGVSSSGSVSLGNIDITSVVCKPTADGNLGVEGSWQGCLVGCTSASANDGQKWDLLDQSERCKDLCINHDNQDKCKDPATGDNQNFPGYCSRQLRTGETICPGLNAAKWTNVVFNVILVNSGSDCGTANINQCIYHCKKDKVNGEHYSLINGSCVKDCKLPWSDDYVSDGTVIGAYDTQNTYCENECGDHWRALKCISGSWSQPGVDKYKYQTCTTHPTNSCTSNHKFNRKIENANCDNNCEIYSVSDNSCKLDNVFYECTCRDTYIFNDDGTACVKPGDESGDDICGSAAGVESQEKPTNNLCTGGAVVKSGPENAGGMWSWTCQLGGAEGKTQICTAPIPGVEPEYECKGTPPANARLIEGSDENLTRDVNNVVYESVAAAGNNKCAYVCKDDYTYVENGNTPQCVKCVVGSYDSATKTCKIELGCNGGGYIYGPSPSTPGGYACLRLGYCSYNGGYPEYVPDPNGESIGFGFAQPVGVDDMAWTCVEGTPSSSQCQYKCKEGYSCVEGRCISCPPITFYNLYGYNSTMASYYTTDVITRIVGGGNGFWNHVGNVDAQTEKGCYFSCDSETSYWDDVWGYGCVKRSCDSLPQGVKSNSVNIIRQPGYTYRQSWTYKTNSEYNEVTSSDIGCFYTCKDGYHEVDRNGVKICIEDDNSANGCPDITFYNLYGFNSTMASYYTTQVITRIVDGGDGLWNHVDDVYAQTEKGCYYTCDLKISYWADVWGYGCVKRACDSLPQGVDANSVDTIRQPGFTYREQWTYTTRAEYNNVSSSDIGCFYTCKDGFHEEDRNGVKVCIADEVTDTGCPDRTFYNLYGFTSTMSSYYTTDVDYRIVDGGDGFWDHVDDVDAQTERGCYFTCKPEISYWGNPWGYGCVKKACASLPQGVDGDSINTIRHPGNTWNQAWIYKTNSEYNSVSSSDIGCFYTCKTGYHEEDKNGTKICVWNGLGGDDDPNDPDNPPDNPPQCNEDEGFELVDGECVSKCRECIPGCGWNKSVRGCTQNEITDNVSELDCAVYGNNWHLVTGEGSAMCVLCVVGTWDEVQGKCN